MKGLAFLLLAVLAGAFTSTQALKRGNTYTFEVNSRQMAGIYGLKPQYAGKELQYLLHVSVEEDEVLVLQPVDLQAVWINDELSSKDWRRAELPRGKPLQRKIKQLMETPIRCVYNKGQFVSMHVEQDLPIWTNNWQKGLCETFQLDLQGYGAPGYHFSHQPNTIRKDSPRRNFFQVIQDGLHSKCEVSYEIRHIAPFVAQSKPDMLPNSEKFCQNSRYMQVTKSKDFDACALRPTLEYSSSPSLLFDGSNTGGNIIQHSAITVFTGCGSRDDFTPLRIIQEDDVKVKLQRTTTEGSVAGTARNMTLVDISQSRPVPQIKSAEEITSLAFKWPHAKYFNSSSIFAKQPTIDEAPLTPYGSILFADNPVKESPHKDHIVERIVSYLDEIASDMENPGEIIDENTHKEAIEVVKLIRLLGTTGLRKVRMAIKNPSQLQNEPKIIKKLFIDALCASGTNPAIKLVLDMIQSHDLDVQRGDLVPQTLMHLFSNAITPTEELLQRIFEFVKWAEQSAPRQVKLTALVNYAHLVSQARLTPPELSPHPTSVYGPFGSPRSQSVHDLTAYLKEKLMSAVQQGSVKKQLEVIAVMKVFRHADLMKALLPIINGELTQRTIVRTHAVYALKSVYAPRDHKVSALMSIALNEGDHSKVRIAAISLLPYVGASASDMQEIAMKSWFRMNRQVHCYAYTLCLALAGTQDKLHREMADKCKAALSLFKPIRCGYSESATYVNADVLEDLELSYAQHFHVKAGRSSLLPAAYHYKSAVLRGLMLSVPTEAAVSFESVEGFIRELRHVIHLSDRKSAPLTSEEIHAIKMELNLKDRKSAGPAAIAMLRKNLEKYRIFATGDNWSQTAQAVYQHIEDQILGHGLQFDWVSLRFADEFTSAFPSLTGAPYKVKFVTPQLAKMQGEARGDAHPKVQGDRQHISIPQNVNVSIVLDSACSTLIYGSVSILDPISKRAITASSSREAVANFPALVKVSANRRDQSVIVAVQPIPGEHSPEIKLVHFQQTPATEILPLLELTPPGTNDETVLINDDVDSDMSEVTMDYLAVKSRLNITLDSNIPDVSSIFQNLYEDHTPLSFLMAPDAIPTLRYGSVSFSIDLEQSPTKEIAFTFSYDKDRKSSKNVREGSYAPESSEEDRDRYAHETSDSDEDSTHDSQYYTKFGYYAKPGYYYRDGYYYKPGYYNADYYVQKAKAAMYKSDYYASPGYYKSEYKKDSYYPSYYSKYFATHKADHAAIWSRYNQKHASRPDSYGSSTESYNPDHSYYADVPYPSHYAKQAYYGAPAYEHYNYKKQQKYGYYYDSSVLHSADYAAQDAIESYPAYSYNAQEEPSSRNPEGDWTTDIPQSPQFSHHMQPNNRKMYRAARFVENAIDTGYTYTVHGKLVCLGNGRRQRQYEAVAAVATDDFADKSGVFFQVERSNVTADDQPSWRLEIDSASIFPIAPLFNRQEVLRMNTAATINGTIKYEHDEDYDTIVDVSVILFRDQDQLKFAQQSPEAERCAKDEQEGLPTTENCANATAQAASLNHGHIYLTFSQPISKWVRNVTYHARDAARAYFYGYSESNPSQEAHEREDLEDSAEEQHQHIHARQQRGPTGDKVVSGFYNSIGCKRTGNCKLGISKIQPQLYTHLIYGYAGVDPQSAQIISVNPEIDLPPYQQPNGQDGFRRFNRLREQNQHMKTFLSVGGPDFDQQEFSQLVQDQEKCKTFAQNAVRFLKQYDFNGLDFYWHSPRSGSDRDGYVVLLKELSEAFNQNGLELCVTMSGVKSVFTEGYSVPDVFRYADLVNVLAFRFHDPSEDETGMNAPLHADPSDSEEDKQNTVEYVLKYLIEQGADRRKMVVGIPTTAIGYTLRDTSNNRVNAPVRGPTPAEPCTRTPGEMGYNEICAKLKENRGWTVKHPSTYMEPYAVKGDKWVSFDDPQTVREKAAMILALGLRGAVIEAIDTDDFNGYCGSQRFPITRAVVSGLYSQRYARRRPQYYEKYAKQYQNYYQDKYMGYYDEYAQKYYDQYAHKYYAEHAAQYKSDSYYAKHSPLYKADKYYAQKSALYQPAEYYYSKESPLYKDYKYYEQESPLDNSQYYYYSKMGQYKHYYSPLSRYHQGRRGIENEIQFEVVFHPDTDVVSVAIQSPEEKLTFNSVPVSPIVDAFLPLELNQRLTVKAIDYALSGQYAPSCTLEGDYVNTFDNVTYDYDMNNCYHVAAMDCSPRGNLSVVAYATDAGSNMKALRIHAGEHRVEVIPQGGKQDPMKVIIERGELPVPEQEVRELYEVNEKGRNHLWLIVKRPQRNAIILESPTFGFHIATDGYTHEISFSNLYRNNTCGMCGDFNGLKQAEFKDPQARVLSDGSLVAASYALQSSRCNKLDSQLIADLREEQKLEIHAHPKPSLQQTRSSRHHEGESERSEAYKCEPEMEQLVRMVDGEKCVSVKSQYHCPRPCRPTRGSPLKSVQFECASGQKKTLRVIQPVRCASPDSYYAYGSTYYAPYSQYYDSPAYLDQYYQAYTKPYSYRQYDRPYYSKYYQRPYYFGQYYQKAYYTGRFYAHPYYATAQVAAQSPISHAAQYYDQYSVQDGKYEKTSKYYDAKQPYAVEFKEYPSYDEYYASPESADKIAAAQFYSYPKYYDQYYSYYPKYYDQHYYSKYYDQSSYYPSYYSSYYSSYYPSHYSSYYPSHYSSYHPSSYNQKYYDSADKKYYASPDQKYYDSADKKYYASPDQKYYASPDQKYYASPDHKYYDSADQKYYDSADQKYYSMPSKYAEGHQYEKEYDASAKRYQGEI